MQIELGPVIAERTITLFRQDGAESTITVRLGKPFQEPTIGDYRCPIQITGIGDNRVRAPWGEHPFVALQYAVNLIGQILDDFAGSQNLENRHEPGDAAPNNWIWQYPYR